MKIAAYVLLADPTWIRTSVRAYYPYVDTIVASYDARSAGWTGSPIRTDQCLAALRSLDTDAKIRFEPGHYSRPFESPLESDTIQRQTALDSASIDADWVLQLDTDEVLPSFDALSRLLRDADEQGVDAVEWPMRVLYRKMPGRRYLQVMDDARHVHFDYPAPVAIRAGSKLASARRTEAPFLRPVVEGHDRSVQVSRPEERGEVRVRHIPIEHAIWHNSWARPPAQTFRKVSSWGHNAGMRSWHYLATRWLPAPALWRVRRDWHPFEASLWPRLATLDSLPFAVDPADEADE